MKIEVLFPEICNLYGDLANIRYLKESDPSIEIIETSLKDTPAFVSSKVDLIYMRTTTEAGLKLCYEALFPHRKKLLSLIDEGVFILLTGNAQDLFGNYITSDDGSEYRGLGIINCITKYQMMNRHNSFYIGDFNNGDETIQIVGFKSIFGHCYADNMGFTDGLLFDTKKGFGRNPSVKEEGFRINNLMSTTLTGPLLPLNPLFTRWLLKSLGSSCDPAYLESAMDAYKQRLLEFNNDHFDPNY